MKRMAFLFFLSFLWISTVAWEFTDLGLPTMEAPHCFHNVPHCQSQIADSLVSQYRNKNLVFIGDSLIRYQYLHLVYTLRHGHPWLQHEDHLPNLNENTWGEWIYFFKGTNSLLYPHEQCDCSYYDGRFFENRYYHDPKLNVTVTYIMFRGNSVVSTNDTNSLYAAEPQQDSAPMLVSGGKLPDFLREIIKYRHVDFAIYSVGFFGLSIGKSIEQQMADRNELAEALKAFADVVIYKTTTYKQDEASAENRLKFDQVDPGYPRMPYRSNFTEADEYFCAYPGLYCMNTSWTLRVPPSMYWDTAHFLEPVYTILNTQLMNLTHWITRQDS